MTPPRLPEPLALGLQRVLARVEARGDSFVDRLVDYVRHPSISAQDVGIAEVAALLVEMLDRLGLEGRAMPTPGHPMVMGRRARAPDRPTVLLYGHYDVQPPEPLELWTSPPFEPAIRDGRVWARGVGDNKGQHLAQLLAIETWLAVEGELPCNVVVLLEGEEEVGSPHIADFVRQNAGLLDCDLVVTADGPLHASGAPVVTCGVRGVASFDLVARTAATDAHSGNYGGVMPNAAWRLVHLLATMRAPDGRITVEGLRDPVRPPDEAARAAAARLPRDAEAAMARLGLRALDAPEDRPFHDRLMFHPTLTINGLSSGYAGPGSKTVLPAEAVAKCDIRLVEAMTPEQALGCVRAHVARHAADVEVVARGGMAPSRTPMDSPFLPVLVAAIRDARGVEPLVYPSLGGSLPDYVWTRILGRPAFTTPYANADEANHAPDENLSIECFLGGVRTGAALLAHLGAMGR